MEVSIVVPAHNEVGTLRRLVDRLRSTLTEADFPHDLEIVLVDDNSTDGTSGLCYELAANDRRVTVVHRTDTPGFGNAIKDGLGAASGDVLIPFMGDLSDDPVIFQNSSTLSSKGTTSHMDRDLRKEGVSKDTHD